MKGWKPIAPKKRFFKYVKKTKTCWNWTGALRDKRYGCMGIGSRTDKSKKIERSHRLSWMLHFGKIPKGKHVLHKCDRPICVRPSHLFLGTHQDNMKDMTKKKRYVSYKGSENGNSKLIESQVREIRNYSPIIDGRMKEFAMKYGVTRCTINAIITRRLWKHLS